MKHDTNTEHAIFDPIRPISQLVKAIGGAILFVVMTSASHASITSNVGLQEEISSIQAKYQPRIDALVEQAESLQEGLPSKEELIINVEVDEMERVEWKLHLPELVMKLQTWKLHVPEFRMVRQTWRFHLPEPGMKYVKIFGGGLHIPAIVMKEHTWKLDVPEVKMVLQTWKLHVPEVTMVLRKLSFDLPKISIGGPRDEVESRKAQGSELGAKAEKVVKQMRSEINHASRGYLQNIRVDITKQFDAALTQLDRGLASMPANASDARRDLSAKRSEIERAKASALAKVDEALLQLG